VTGLDCGAGAALFRGGNSRSSFLAELIVLHTRLLLRRTFQEINTMRICSRFLVIFPAALIAVFSCQAVSSADDAPKRDAKKSRVFDFKYSATVTGLGPGRTAHIWLPVPPTNEDQEVKIASKELPGPEQISSEPKFGNQVLYVEGKADEQGTISLSVTYHVLRREVRGDFHKKSADMELLESFLKPDARVPVGGKSMELIRDRDLPKDQMETARVLYDVVNQHMRYSKEGTGWGRGDSDWACASGYGNCTDFHSMFISLARAQKIPAKFEIGFPLPEKRGQGEVAGYHCWAKFKPKGHDWIPVDISEANKNPKMHDYYFGNLTEDRVAFSMGRDLNLVPKQDGEPLNFFVYPYVEVDGKPYPADKVQRKFTFKDVE
jgi:transglutaminase-like putative cysteine protease